MIDKDCCYPQSAARLEAMPLLVFFTNNSLIAVKSYDLTAKETTAKAVTYATALLLKNRNH